MPTTLKLDHFLPYRLSIASNAVSDAIWIYQDRELEQNLRRFGWRQARRRVLAQGAGPQGLEVRTLEWTAPVFRQVAEGLAGQQWAAYLRLLWAGTPLAERSGAGHGLGIAAHVAEDIRSKAASYGLSRDEFR